MLDLAAARHFFDLTGWAGPVVHKDALAGGQVALGRFILKNLRLSHPHRQEQGSRHDEKSFHENVLLFT